MQTIHATEAAKAAININRVDWIHGSVCYADGAVCFAAGRQWFLREGIKGALCDQYMWSKSFDEIITEEDYQLNTIKQGDCISTSELDEQKYNGIIKTFELFGFKECISFKSLKLCELLLIDSDGDAVGCNKAHIEAKRKLTYQQIMAIGGLKRLEIERDKLDKPSDSELFSALKAAIENKDYEAVSTITGTLCKDFYKNLSGTAPGGKISTDEELKAAREHFSKTGTIDGNLLQKHTLVWPDDFLPKDSKIVLDGVEVDVKWGCNKMWDASKTTDSSDNWPQVGDEVTWLGRELVGTVKCIDNGLAWILCPNGYYTQQKVSSLLPPKTPEEKLRDELVIMRNKTEEHFIDALLDNFKLVKKEGEA